VTVAPSGSEPVDQRSIEVELRKRLAKSSCAAPDQR
jgi:hypothetical protein